MEESVATMETRPKPQIELLRIGLPTPNCENNCKIKSSPGAIVIEEIQAFNILLNDEAVAGFPSDLFALEEERNDVLERCVPLCRATCMEHKKFIDQKEKETQVLNRREAMILTLREEVAPGWRSHRDQQSGLSKVFEHEGGAPYLVRFDIEDFGDNQSVHAQLMKKKDRQDIGPRFTADPRSGIVYIQRHGNQDPNVFEGMGKEHRKQIGGFILLKTIDILEANPVMKSLQSESAEIFYQYNSE